MANDPAPAGGVANIKSDEGAGFWRVKWTTLEPRVNKRTGTIVPAGTPRDCIAWARYDGGYEKNVFFPRHAPDDKTCLRFRLVKRSPDLNPPWPNDLHRVRSDAAENPIKPRWMTAEWAAGVPPNIEEFDPANAADGDWPGPPVPPANNVANTLNAAVPQDDDHGNFDHDDGGGAAFDGGAPQAQAPRSRPRVGQTELAGLGQMLNYSRRPPIPDNNDDGGGPAWDDYHAPPPPPPRPLVGYRELAALGPRMRGPRRPRRSARVAAANRGAAGGGAR